MKILALLAFLSLGGAGFANSTTKPADTTPVVHAVLPPDFKEGVPSQLHFFSLTHQPVQQGGFCLGAECTTLTGKIGYRVPAKDANGKDNYLRCDSVEKLAMKSGDVVNFVYTVDGNTTVYRRAFTLNSNSGEKYELALEKSDVVQAGGPVQYASVPNAPGQYQGAAPASSGHPFLDLINAHRPNRPLIYDPSLNINTAQHTPPPGASMQVMSFHGSMEASVHNWLFNDAEWGWAHRNYLLSATYAGVAGGPGRWIINLR